MATTEKSFDAVRMMRTIRDDLAEQLHGMTFNEEQAYIRDRLRPRATGPIAGARASRRELGEHASEGKGKRKTCGPA